ncbi:hypothetical protein MC885_009423 [Smutsia gigantea]|nr:hypothetical protein MC885_009423 [Smutsia gigantea]
MISRQQCVRGGRRGFSCNSAIIGGGKRPAFSSISLSGGMGRYSSAGFSSNSLFSLGRNKSISLSVAGSRQGAGFGSACGFGAGGFGAGGFGAGFSAGGFGGSEEIPGQVRKYEDEINKRTAAENDFVVLKKVQQLQITVDQYGDNLKSTKIEISELNRMIQRLRAEIENVKKQAEIQCHEFAPLLLLHWFFLISTNQSDGEHWGTLAGVNDKYKGQGRMSGECQGTLTISVVGGGASAGGIGGGLGNCSGFGLGSSFGISSASGLALGSGIRGSSASKIVSATKRSHR